MTDHADKSYLKPAPIWLCILRDVSAALLVAAVVLGASFAAGLIEGLIRRVF